MTTRELHLLIEQNVQQMSNFAYLDMEKEEVDLVINYVIFKLIRNLLTPDKALVKNPRLLPDGGFEATQVTLDDFEVLKVLNHLLTGLTPFTDGHNKGVSGTFPNEYEALINDRTLVKKTGCSQTVKPNRLTRTDKLYEILGTELGKTVADSPVSMKSNNKLFVYNDDTFAINGIVVDYYKKPQKIDYNNPVNGTQVIEFRESFCNKIAEWASIVICKITEQPQLKVEYLKELSQESI